jgi:tetratricopeptide (TPR) repeat protein
MEIVRVCHSAFHTGYLQRDTSSNLNKIYRLYRVLIILISLAVFSLAVFGQTSTNAGDASSQLNPGDSTADRRQGQIPSPYVVSVTHLRVPAKAARHLEAAQKYFAHMHIAQAAIEIDHAIEIYPSFAQAFRMKALVSLAEKDFTGSVENAAHAISLDGADAYSWVALATAFNSLNEWPEAEAAAGQALALDASAWQGRLELAKSFYGQARFTLAVSILDQLNRDIPDVHLVRANSLMGLGRPQEAARQFSLFLREAPGDSRADRILRILETAPSQSEE